MLKGAYDRVKFEKLLNVIVEYETLWMKDVEIRSLGVKWTWKYSLWRSAFSRHDKWRKGHCAMLLRKGYSEEISILQSLGWKYSCSLYNGRKEWLKKSIWDCKENKDQLGLP